MNYLQLCEAVRRECNIQGPEFVDVSGVAGDFARIVNWVKDADIAIQSRWADWDFLWTTKSFNTVASTAVYTLTDLSITDLGQWQMYRFLRDPTSDTGGKLYEVAYKTWLETLATGTQVQATPTQIARRPDNALIVHPKPDAIYTITGEYYKAPVVLSTSTSTPLIPTQYHRVIVALAKLYVGHWMTSMGMQQGAGVTAAAAAEYAEWLPKLEAHSLRTYKGRLESNPDTPMVVVPE